MNGYFALDIPHFKADAEITSISIVIMLLILAIAVFITLRHYIPIFISRSRNKRAEKIRAEKNIWFDPHKSILHRASQQVVIPEIGLEYFVCKLVFEKPKVWRGDFDILEAAGETDKNARAVYFAVDRINKKARKAFKINDNLLKRKKEHTRLNDLYF